MTFFVLSSRGLTAGSSEILLDAAIKSRHDRIQKMINCAAALIRRFWEKKDYEIFNCVIRRVIFSAAI